jgi:fucose 4-O-acetylase-like acetyltransferase
MRKTRDKQLDAVKGFAIILVVFAHVAVYANPENVKTIFLAIIYSFHMPLFFFISGYLVFGRVGPSSVIWIQKKFKQLIIPYIIFSLFFFYVIFWPSYNFTLGVLVQTLSSYTVYNSAWFLPVLFESFLILSLCIIGEKILGKISFILVLFLISCFLPLTSLDSIGAIHQIVLDTPYVIIGYLICFYKEGISKNILLIEIFGSALFPILCVFKFGSYYPGINNSLFYLYYGYALAATGIILSWWIIKSIVNYKISYLFIVCGIFTMEIYLTHLIILNYFTLRNWPMWFGTGTTAVISGTSVVITLSLILSLILSYNEKISTIIFGKWSIKYL